MAKAGQAVADVHLDGDGMALRAEERGGRDGGEHGDLLRSQHGAAAGSTGGTGDRPDDGCVRTVPPGCDDAARTVASTASWCAPRSASRGRDRGARSCRRAPLILRRRVRLATTTAATRRALLRRGAGERRRHRHAAARRPRTTSTTRSTSTATSATRRRSRSSRNGATCCSTSRRRAPWSPTTPSRCSGRVAVAYATERSAVAVRNWLLANCAVDLGPVATLVPQIPPARRRCPACRRRSPDRTSPPSRARHDDDDDTAACSRHRRRLPLPADQTRDQWISPRRRMTLSTRP